MTTQYTRNVLKMVVAQICQTIGWHSINSTPLEFMVDLMQEYIFQLSKLTQQYSQVLGRSDANLDDLGLAFQHMNIDLQELAEYVRNVDSVPCVVSVPKLPIYKESHLNFLKPGSREVVTRPVHIHEHLPAMYPGTEEEYISETKQIEIINSSAVNESLNTSEEDSNENNNIIKTNGISNEESSDKVASQVIFKRPGDPISFDGPLAKKAKTTEEGRPLREIHSVIMTTSGFLSTAREGKLPEARTPQQTCSESSAPASYPMVPPEVKIEKKLKKIPKKISENGKPENKENKKKKIPKDTLFKPDEIKDVKVKKLTGMKEVAKLKALKSGNKASSPNLAGPSNIAIAGKVQGKISGSPKHIKNVATASKIKTEKINDAVQITNNSSFNECKEETIDKLPIEPDKQKLNIFKKISSKPKEDKEKEVQDPQYKLKELGVCENLSSLTVDDGDRLRNDVIVKLEDKKPIIQSPAVNNNAIKVSSTEDNMTSMISPGSDVYMFDDMSPPGTPSTPKTPDIGVLNIPLEQKKKRKEKTGKKKEPKPKTPKSSISPKKARLSTDSSEVSILERPKTPQAPEQHLPSRDSNLPPTLPFPFFSPFPAAPGLIPHPMFPLPLHKGMVPGMVGPPNPAAVMPGMLRQRFFRPKLDGNRPLVPPTFVNDSLQSPTPAFPLKSQQQSLSLPLASEKPRVIKSPEKELISPKITTPTYLAPETMTSPVLSSGAGVPAPLTPAPISPVVPAPLLPPNVPLTKPLKLEKSEKVDKKSKEHKKEKKDKLKKKKEKKEKHKEKGDKIKDKKEKSIQKKEKLEKIKEKKEKKEKRKEKEKEKEANKKIAKEEKEKAIESVPKITLKLGPAGGSPRPPTPDSALTKKITIKPPKKPEDETKREPTPELARISALVTRPPKQKSTSKKAEEGLLEAYNAALPSEASFSSSALTPTSRVKKPVFKALPRRDPSPTPLPFIDSFNALETQENTQYCFTLNPSKEALIYKLYEEAKAEAVPKTEDTKEDKENGGNTLTTKSTVTVDQSGRKIWICPACGKQDDGSPMIGCDDCDAWYHWVCVGIQVAPAVNEDWYCRLCIAKKQEQYHDKKKKKRKKKLKVNA